MLHIEFEKIPPFMDVNGRVGRMILHQQFLNNDLLPAGFSPAGKHRQAFRQYGRNKDYTGLVHILAKAELEPISRLISLKEKLEKSREGNGSFCSKFLPSFMN